MHLQIFSDHSLHIPHEGDSRTFPLSALDGSLQFDFLFGPGGRPVP